MDIVAILGFGAIGLGFLLAVLTYRLLGRTDLKERPIYVFMGFCCVLIMVGATLQFADSRARSSLEAMTKDYDGLKERHHKAEKALQDAQANVSGVQSEQRATLANLSTAQSSLNETRGLCQRLTESMQTIVKNLESTQTPLKEAHEYMTGLSCDGDAHGKALRHGAVFGGKITDAQNAIAAAQNLASQYISKEKK